ncbi:4-hydroxy-tetrahydrodipicolinate reductase [Dissulfurirhabdus thermomarina]|uniref:4-hydroxy-tetrahydrodipicolinate reductase n=1 Tax=Dissulfurirhabdus thermomarina TaxID=1765737 RepID=A0A6N9TTJ3_DISTH|nr:4-hydroxy-tetrahydrodipicolinate reductase [Dissulfurirhabdus thermomarina]NDY42757.1 4-hydroxy-tetrahydrodipicolinate reductase [Dissulfurirhabdus thermomarina]NMX22601.1 4-hydroxy-tetrahydrodipicolinate reductase [Dissulfurirhabdus thermomarina]
MVKAIIAGVAGRMGGRILHAIHADDGISLAAAFERPGSPAVGADAGTVCGLAPLGVTVRDRLEDVIGLGDVIIDFTFHEATIAHARLAAEHARAMVIGTTGLTRDEMAELKDLAARFPCVQAPNMSVGVNLLYKLVETAARVLGDDYDVEIVEAHHRMKKDAPSGTALQLARVAAAALDRDLEETGVYARHGMIGERTRKEIGIQTVRAGDIVGEHTVLFGGIGERIELVHRASSRDTFARGAVRAAKWVVSRPPGLYDMQDVLGLKD